MVLCALWVLRYNGTHTPAWSIVLLSSVPCLFIVTSPTISGNLWPFTVFILLLSSRMFHSWEHTLYSSSVFYFHSCGNLHLRFLCIFYSSLLFSCFSGLNERVSHKLKCWNTWSPVGGTVWLGRRCGLAGEDVS